MTCALDHKGNKKEEDKCSSCRHEKRVKGMMATPIPIEDNLQTICAVANRYDDVFQEKARQALQVGSMVSVCAAPTGH